jgi:hypothetical protein
VTGLAEKSFKKTHPEAAKTINIGGRRNVLRAADDTQGTRLRCAENGN